MLYRQQRQEIGTMKVICVEDELPVLQELVAMCLELEAVETAVGFGSAEEALSYLKKENADTALLDIHLPGMDGLKMPEVLRAKRPQMKVIFVTGDAGHALEAFAVHASGYLLKPVRREKLASEIAYAAEGMACRRRGTLEARTFGNFDLLLDGRPVLFRQAKCKELLAYLIDRQGANVSRREAFAVLYEDRMYDRPMQKQFDVIIRSMRTTLTDYGIGDIFELGGAVMRIIPERISCDAWRFFRGDPPAVHAYFGEYMNNYSWARQTESNMTWKMMHE